MTYRMVIPICLSILLSLSRLPAQTNINAVSFSFGTVRTFLDSYMNSGVNQYARYHEIEAGGNVVTRSFGWGAYFGYWSDGIDTPLPIRDYITYSYSSRIVGIRIAFFPVIWGNEFPLTAGVVAGLSRHFISGRFVGGGDYFGNPGVDFTRRSDIAEAGITVRVPVLSRLSLRGDIHQLIPLVDDDFPGDQKGRRAYTLGLEVSVFR